MQITVDKRSYLFWLRNKLLMVGKNQSVNKGGFHEVVYPEDATGPWDAEEKFIRRFDQWEQKVWDSIEFLLEQEPGIRSS